MTRSLEITRDHQITRTQEIARDHQRSPEITRDHQRAKCSAESCSMERVCDGEEEEEKEGPRPCYR